MSNRLSTGWLLPICVTALLAACSADEAVPSPASEPYWPTAGWRVSTPQEQGMDAGMLEEVSNTIVRRGDHIDSMAVIRNGYMVEDIYFYLNDADSLHVIHSCTKSIISVLIGIAIDQGYIAGVDQPVLDIFSDRTVANLDDHKEAMTLEHLLTMSSGFDCQDSYLYRWRGLDQMRQSEDWVQFMLDLPMREAPGTRFEYCNGGSYLLSAIIQATTGVPAHEFAQEHLFDPLGITDVVWATDPKGITIGWGELRMKPHDMAKIGYLYLNKGQWDGEQIVSARWVEESTRRHIDAGTLSDGYGYQWWVDDAGYYMAMGYAGQFIYVMPDLDMVVVFTSTLAERDFFVPETLLNEFIIPAVETGG